VREGENRPMVCRLGVLAFVWFKMLSFPLRERAA